MNTITGHLIRLTGLLVEMIGVWAVFTARDDQHPTLISLPSGHTVLAAWVAVGLGFILWFTGTVIVYMSRTQQKSRGKDPEERDRERFL